MRDLSETLKLQLIETHFDVNVFYMLPQAEDTRISFLAKIAFVHELERCWEMRVLMDFQMSSLFE